VYFAYQLPLPFSKAGTTGLKDARRNDELTKHSDDDVMAYTCTTYLRWRITLEDLGEPNAARCHSCADMGWKYVYSVMLINPNVESWRQNKAVVNGRETWLTLA
jgi:hypothetical protein